MRSADTALSVFTEAAQRFNSGTATKVDEVLLALWDETKEQAQKMREMSLKISMLETQNTVTVGASTEYASLVRRIAKKSGNTSVAR